MEEYGELPRPKVKRKELKREIANLRETVEGLQKRIDAIPENQVKVLQRRLGEIEHHITVMAQEAYHFRRIIREAGDGRSAPSARDLFRLCFGQDIEDTDVKLSAEETAKVFENIKR